MIVKARAKINLRLEVLGKRPDGYHDLCMVMQSIKLHDTLTIEKTGKPGVLLSCNREDLIAYKNNLAYKAADFIVDKYNIGSGVSIKLTKRIPVAAGLGGGSSDCAATLRGMNNLFNLNINKEELLEIGKKFGADVPFCLVQGTALAEGIGEKLTLLPPHPHTWIVVACPDFYISTAEIFRQWDKDRRSETANTNMIKEKVEQGRSSNPVNALEKKDIKAIANYFYNDLEGIAAKANTEITSLIRLMRNLGAVNASMSGSGPTVFGYFTNRQAALTALHALQNQNKLSLRDVILTETYNP